MDLLLNVLFHFIWSASRDNSYFSDQLQVWKALYFIFLKIATNSLVIFFFPHVSKTVLWEEKILTGILFQASNQTLT